MAIPSEWAGPPVEWEGLPVSPTLPYLRCSKICLMRPGPSVNHSLCTHQGRDAVDWPGALREPVALFVVGLAPLVASEEFGSPRPHASIAVVAADHALHTPSKGHRLELIKTNTQLLLIVFTLYNKIWTIYKTFLQLFQIPLHKDVFTIVEEQSEQASSLLDRFWKCRTCQKWSSKSRPRKPLVN